SKALIFYYFGTKKALYFFLVDFTYNLLMRELSQSQIGATSDFFERIRAISHVELDLMQQHVAITGFIRSMYFETDPEVAPELSAMIAGGGPTRSKLALDGVDLSKFMDDVDPQLVVNILVKFTEGVVNSKTNAESLEELVRELNDCLDLLKRHLYKEEYR
ncbi:MAG: TetR/AcrR family transcriptional regulator, partial [Actinomycetia bacterium]|nr:TetR/AcrR family transcriptional regulator [Actinomycetes bacterium]